MEKFKYAFFMVGFPGSGKSTWVSENINACKLPTNPIIISSDDLIEEWSAAEGLTYNQGFSKFISPATKEIDRRLIDALNVGRNVLIDRTNLTIKSRKKYLDYIPSDYKKVAIEVYCDDETRNNRLNQRPGKNIPAYVLEQMILSYQKPTEAEGFSSVTRINSRKSNDDE